MYTGLIDYRLRLWAPASALRAISAVAEVLVIGWCDGSVGRTLDLRFTFHGFESWPRTTVGSGLGQATYTCVSL